MDLQLPGVSYQRSGFIRLMLLHECSPGVTDLVHQTIDRFLACTTGCPQDVDRRFGPFVRVLITVDEDVDIAIGCHVGI